MPPKANFQIQAKKKSRKDKTEEKSDSTLLSPILADPANFEQRKVRTRSGRTSESVRSDDEAPSKRQR